MMRPDARRAYGRPEPTTKTRAHGTVSGSIRRRGSACEKPVGPCSRQLPPSGSSVASRSSHRTKRRSEAGALQPHRLQRVNRERVKRTLTFWLRPEFVLRVVNRFQKIAGFDRAIALASGALTATIPLAIVTSSLASRLGGKGTAERIIERYELTGGGAEAVKDIFAPPEGASTSLGIL